MQYRRKSTGAILTLEDEAQIGEGGEARIFPMPGSEGLAAKIYRRPTAEHAAKLMAMLAAPPDDPMRGAGHVSIAWPVDLLLAVDGSRQVAGFLMPRVTGMALVLDFYNPRARLQRHPLFNYVYLLRAAGNLATAVHAIHQRGCVIGDVNESNVLVAPTALVTLLDTDSFQVPDRGRSEIYRCIVGKPEFTPPELQGADFRQVTRKPENDHFGLAVLIFHLLMEGTHPFDGVFTGSDEPAPIQGRIADGHFPHASRPRGAYRPKPLAPPFDHLHPGLRSLFRQCFEAGHTAPAQRPDAHAWRRALAEAEQSLLTCALNPQHRYGTHLDACPWCERTVRLGGRDPFPFRKIGAATPRRSRSTPAPRGAAMSPTTAQAMSTNLLAWVALLAAVVAILACFDGPGVFPVLMAGLGGFIGWAGMKRAGRHGGLGRRPALVALSFAGAALVIQGWWLGLPLWRTAPATQAVDASGAALEWTRRPIPPVASDISSDGQPRTIADLGIDLLPIPSGTFTMGSPATESGRRADEGPQTRVTLTKPFWLGKTEVTQGQCQGVMGNNPSYFKGGALPMEQVSWNDAMSFCRKLTERERAAGRLPEGYAYTLPTEAQWEYACRAGTGGAYAGSLESMAWYFANSANNTQPVATKQANAWGLHDMHGNVREWCLDWYSNKLPGGSVSDPVGAPSGSDRIFRGGCWNRDAGGCRSALRLWVPPGFASNIIGFRLALAPSP